MLINRHYCVNGIRAVPPGLLQVDKGDRGVTLWSSGPRETDVDCNCQTSPQPVRTFSFVSRRRHHRLLQGAGDCVGSHLPILL
jgi:hypothetical protein